MTMGMGTPRSRRIIDRIVNLRRVKHVEALESYLNY
jgi:hypothetical protein